MIVAFKFMTPADKGQFTVFTPVLMLAHSDAVREKIDTITIWALAFVLSVLLWAGNVFEFSNILNNTTWLTIESIGIGVSLPLLILSFFSKKPLAVKVCAIMGTEGFKEYVMKQLSFAEAAIRPENVKAMRLSYKTIKHYNKMIASMQLLLEITDELDEVSSLQEEVALVEKNVGNLYGLKLKDITKEMANANR